MKKISLLFLSILSLSLQGATQQEACAHIQNVIDQTRQNLRYPLASYRSYLRQELEATKKELEYVKSLSPEGFQRNVEEDIRQELARVSTELSSIEQMKSAQASDMKHMIDQELQQIENKKSDIKRALEEVPETEKPALKKKLHELDAFSKEIQRKNSKAIAAYREHLEIRYNGVLAEKNEMMRIVNSPQALKKEAEESHKEMIAKGKAEVDAIQKEIDEATVDEATKFFKTRLEDQETQLRMIRG